MKFAQELDRDLVPEWRIKYLDYKAGKKQVKQVAKAVAKANGSSRSKFTPRHTYRGANSPFFAAKNNSPLDQRRDQEEAGFGRPSRKSPDSQENSEDSDEATAATPILIPKRRRPSPSPAPSEYGSFIPTPSTSFNPNRLVLPNPALEPDPDKAPSPRTGSPQRVKPQIRSSSLPRNAYQVGPTTPSAPKSMLSGLRQGASERLRAMSTFAAPIQSDSRSPFLTRLLSFSGNMSSGDSKRVDVNLEAFDQVRAAQKEFFKWMDKELDKIETFYKSKENQAGERLEILREQLHEMRNRRIDEIAEASRNREKLSHEQHMMFGSFGFQGHDDKRNGKTPLRHSIIAPVERALGTAMALTIGPHPGPNSKSLVQMGPSPELTAGSPSQQQINVDDGRDYVRRPRFDDGVTYRAAKRKLKLAMKEFYRGLELLKSYALLNRTAFRKINKKYDKTVDAHPTLQYMSDKVNVAHFVQSHLLDGHIHAVEDLYARYFERGNHKIAMGKLRCSSGNPGDHAGSAFRCGLVIGTGLVFAVQGLIYASDIIRYSPDPILQMRTNYLLQIYGGYFLALYLFACFVVDCSIWSRNRINYVFIFELDPRNHLDWRQLAEFPAFLTLVLGLFIWVNFSQFGPPGMFLYYPVILISATALVIFLPAPYIAYKSRQWFAYSHWRLLLAGLYPVEFRDFFLGDMYCSLTYVTSNIELFFCLYATQWRDPTQCNSGHSRLLGFFSTLPGIWRALQCLRRYYDTRAAFPHLANCGKYTMTIIYYVSLSLYRFEGTWSLFAIFITFATLNSLYCSLWDLFMDWSLCQPYASKRFLRDVRGYSSPYFYYFIMITDVILRFNWIFYALYTFDKHSAVVSFLVSFSEVTRRALWTLLRVENEHCANVAHFKASRDVPLPYVIHEGSTDHLSQQATEASEPGTAETLSQPSSQQFATGLGTAADTEAGVSGTVRFRLPNRTLTRLVAEAHMQDFEKKRKPNVANGLEDKPLKNFVHEHLGMHNEHMGHHDGSSDEGGSDDDEGDATDAQSVMDVMDADDIVHRHRRDVNAVMK